MRILTALLLCTAASAAPALHESQFVAGPDGAPAGWTRWSPREEIAPRTWVDPDRSRTGAGSLAISGVSNPGAYGGWDRVISDVEPGSWRRVTAYYQAQGLDQERQQALLRLAWRNAAGKSVGRPDYAYKLDRVGDWNRLVVEAPAPPDASAAVIELRLGFAPQGAVWWDDISFEAIDAPAARPVRVSSVNLRPRQTYSKQKSLEAFAAVVESEVAEADIIVLPEGVTVVGTGKPYAEVAAPVPGPDTEFLGRLARAKNAYLVAGVYEREGALVYNTSVLLDREGKFVGKYRKVYLPREEIEGGITPGDDYPTFATDFGRVGMMICWDVQYADPARALSMRGAELLLMPIWGGNETLAAARAIENHVFLAASGYDHPTYVMDPMGEMLYRAPEEGTVAHATIDLAKRYEWEWLGSMRGRYFHELRRDVAVDPGR